MTRFTRGFSLIEMAVVLLVVVLLLGGLLVPFTTQVEQRRIAETQKALDEIQEALIGYALSHMSAINPNPAQPYLPCPDTDNDGVEDRAPAGGINEGACMSRIGRLPWATLGVGAQDAWGNRLLYSVTPEFANRAPSANPGFDLDLTGDITVCDRSPTLGACAALATNIPAIVVSFGKNGRGATNINNAAANPAPLGADERENSGDVGAATNFVSRVPVAPSQPCDGAGQPRCEFDDLVMWLSPNVLFNRMVAAGRLP